jgi:exonuclease III
MLKLISWNTNHRKQQAKDQVEAMLEHKPDIVALQEVTPETAIILKNLLEVGGICQVKSSRMLAAAAPRYKLGVLIGSRFPIGVDTKIDFSLPVGWKQKSLSLVVDSPNRGFELHNVHIPPGSTNDRAKVAVLEAIFKDLSREPQRPRLLCGDFNTPRYEGSSGEIVTWAQHENGRLGWKGRDKTWDDAERCIMTGPCGMRDAFRNMHGYAREEFSWQHSRRGKATRRRYDHVFSSPDVEVLRCEYIHSWRESRLSDHSAIEVDFTFIPNFQSAMAK